MCTVGNFFLVLEARHGHQEPHFRPPTATRLAQRRARGLTQSDVADRARVSRRFVLNLESGKANCHLGKSLTVMMSVGLVGVALPVEAMQAALG